MSRTPTAAIVLPLLLASGAACRRSSPAPEKQPGIPAANLPPDAVAKVLRESKERQAKLVRNEGLEILERRFRRLNCVAMGRDPADGRAIYHTKDESRDFRQLATTLRGEAGDGPLDALGEELADRGLHALVDDRGVFRVPLAPGTFAGDTLGPAALEVLSLTRDLPLLLAHYGLVAHGNRSVLPPFTLRTMLRVRWNLETGRPAEHALAPAERIAWLEFRGRYRTWAPFPERRQALEELARLLPAYPLDTALAALAASSPAPGRLHIVEEGEQQ